MRRASVRHSASFCTPPNRRSESGFRMCVDGAPSCGMQMRPSASTATPILFCTPASDMDTPSSPTRKGLLGSSSMMRSSAASSGTGPQPPGPVEPGWPIDSAPAVSRPISLEDGEVSPGSAPSRRPTICSCSASGSRLAAHGAKTLRWRSAWRQRHQDRERERAARAQPLGLVDERRTVLRGPRWCRPVAFRRRPGGQPRCGLLRVSSGRSGSSALSSLFSAIRSSGRRPTAAATARALPSWQVGLPASRSMMKRRPTPVAKARSSWRQFLRFAALANQGAEARLACLAAVASWSDLADRAMMFPYGNNSREFGRFQEKCSRSGTFGSLEGVNVPDREHDTCRYTQAKVPDTGTSRSIRGQMFPIGNITPHAATSRPR